MKLKPIFIVLAMIIPFGCAPVTLDIREQIAVNQMTYIVEDCEIVYQMELQEKQPPLEKVAKCNEVTEAIEKCKELYPHNRSDSLDAQTIALGKRTHCWRAYGVIW